MDQREVRGRLVDIAALAADQPAQRRVRRVPRGLQHRLLPRVLGPPDVAAAADGPPQGGNVQLERDDVLHDEDDSGRPRHFAGRSRHLGCPAWLCGRAEGSGGLSVVLDAAGELGVTAADLEPAERAGLVHVGDGTLRFIIRWCAPRCIRTLR
jgi:hypothetical protein